MYREIAERFLSILVNRAFIFWALTVRNQSLLEVRSSFFSLANRVLYLKKKFKRKFSFLPFLAAIRDASEALAWKLQYDKILTYFKI